MSTLKLLLCTVAALSVSVISTAQVQLVKKGKPVTRIVLTTNQSVDSTAALLLQDFVQRSTQAKLPVISAEEVKKLRKGDVLIGNGMSNASFVSDKLKEDGFLLSTDDGMLRIVTGGDSGSIYAVTTLLEDYLGVRYWGEEEYDLRPMKDVIIPKINRIDNPAFSHRQTFFYGMKKDSIYTHFARLEYKNELFAGGYWVHTSRRLVPVEKYGADHPEYFSMIDGERRLSKNTQLCLTNPEVLEIVTQQLDSVFKANPDKNMASFSQNDGDKTWCRCPKCQKIIEEEGSPSGLYLRFVNELARRFPDKQISTLSYLFTVVPPKVTKPLPNVNIMLCDINCYRQLPLDQIPSKANKEFMDALVKWSSMTNNIFIWDYGINFHNFMAPFPNFHILGENMKIFRDHHVNAYFLQMVGTYGCDMAELRTWLTSRLMWNPYQNVDELMWKFLKGYYGEKSAPFMYQYIKLMEGALVGNKQPLWIYDTPISFKDGMLNPKIRKCYNDLFDQAEKYAANDSIFLARIQRSRLSLQYSELEIIKTYPGFDVKDASEKLEYFHKQCKRFNVTLLSERRMGEQDYYDFYRNRYLVMSKSLAQGAKVTYLIEPSRRYTKIAPTALTDGILGGNTFNQCWIGWEGTDGSFVIDLGAEKKISGIDVDLLHSLNDWIWPPKNISYYLSNDNKNFKLVGKEQLEGKEQPKQYIYLKHDIEPQTARYIRIDVDGQKIIPLTANRAWFFIDEVIVR